MSKTTMKEYTLADVQKHNTPTDAWIVIHNKGKAIPPIITSIFRMLSNTNTKIPPKYTM